MINNTGDPRFGELLKAVRFAADKHRDQRRKGAEASPYINHCIEVADLLAHVGGVEHLASLQAAILHDTVEDTETTSEELAELFGSEVAALVAEVTDDKAQTFLERKQSQIDHAPHLSLYAKQIKLADKICNVTSLATHPPLDWPAKQQLKYVDWAEKVVEGLRGVNPALEARFDEAVEMARSAVKTVAAV